ncbi:GNAT family N-acetyltransferase [Aurantibacillus circumpalustris]|uniref:GNAT family N-acetyltransferase n=1 Tax=Aurantibacillus circumpalustris TaxID=3036359 RepID=UPI00295A60C2|nr:GNAT family N-acetyltransferase [Aurantibacillus circumpalustris]
MNKADLKTEVCSTKNFELVKKYIAEFELDDRQLKQNEFLTVSDDKGLLGFGRLREYSDFTEFCSLGIITHERSKGLGKHLCEVLIKKAPNSIYIVCVIPSYFVPMGFEICTEYPEEILDKLKYCNNSLCVEEGYVVMRKLK